MTVSVQTPYVAYTGSGSSGPFVVPFRFDMGADLVVTVDGAVLSYPADISAAGFGGDGGSITTTAIVGVGSAMVIRRAVPLTQALDLLANDTFPPDSVEYALDRLMMALQDVKVTLGLGGVGGTGSFTGADIIAALGYTPENIAHKGLAFGYVPLGSDGKIATGYLPAGLTGGGGTGGNLTATSTATGLTAATSDADAASKGVGVGNLYLNGNVLQVRLA